MGPEFFFGLLDRIGFLKMNLMLNVAKYNGSSWQEWRVIQAIHDTI
jgi:hypothetical protein